MKEKAYAKVNLYLDVLRKRKDRFHDLETIMAPLELHDLLTFKKLQEATIEITTSKKITDDVKDNLVYKVADYMIKTFEINGGVSIHIEKNIPISAGLAGGSADAAATLRGINKLFKLKLSKEKLAEIGETFGADIPFCVHNKMCIARGKGEQLMFLNRRVNWPVMIVVPAIEVSTKKVFDAVSMNDIVHTRITSMSNAIYNKNYDLMVRELHNALEPFTFQLLPKVQELKKLIEHEDIEGALMSGTGPAMMVFQQNKKIMLNLSDRFSRGNSVFITKIK